VAELRGFTRFDDFVVRSSQETRLPSVTAGLISGGGLVHSVEYGLRDLVSKEPATVDTLYGVGSITKSFTALSIAKLVDEGKLDFHDRVADYLPLRQKAFEDVEVHHLLTHTSGVPGLGFAEAIIFRAIGLCAHPLPVLDADDIGDFLDEVDGWAVSKPGERMFYLNEGYYLLGRLISKVSGRPYESYVEAEILRPLGMTRSYFAREQIEAEGDVATPYIVRGDRSTTSVFPYGSDAAGGLVTSLSDLARYVAMLAGGGEVAGKRLVSKSSLERMQTSYAAWPSPMLPGEGYGYGLQIIPDLYGRRVVGHGGSVEVFTSSFLYVPGAGLGAAALANGAGYSMTQMALYGLTTLLGEDPEELPMVRQERILKQLEGKYAAYKGIVRAEVKRNGSFLILSGDDIGDNIVLVPERLEEDVAAFFTIAGTARMAVEFSYGREVTGLIYGRYSYRKTGPPGPAR
jgi:CubicO group peptidase (beta-lactamase class C family)